MNIVVFIEPFQVFKTLNLVLNKLKGKRGEVINRFDITFARTIHVASLTSSSKDGCLIVNPKINGNITPIKRKKRILPSKIYLNFSALHEAQKEKKNEHF